MHSYLRAVGFSEIKKRRQIEEIIQDVIETYDEKNIIENSKFLVIIKCFFQPERLMKSAFLSCEKPSCKE